MGRRQVAAWIGVFLLVLIGKPTAGEAQSAVAPRPNPSRVSGSLFLGVGDGPSPLVEYGARAFYRHFRTVGAYADVRRLQTGVGVGCAQSWPDSYACSVRAVSVGGGVVVEPLQGKPIRPVLEGGVGFLDRTDGVVQGGAALRASAALAIRIDPGGSVSIKGFARQTLVRDQAYKELMGEALNYWSLGLELEIYLKRRTVSES